VTELVYWVIEAVLLINAMRSRRWAAMVIAFSLPFSRRLPSFPVPLLNYQNLVFLAALLSFARSPVVKDAPAGRVRYLLPMAMLSLFFTAAFVNTQMTFVPRTFWKLWDSYENVMDYKALMTCWPSSRRASRASASKARTAPRSTSFSIPAA
jgi:hypothetical protein